MLNKYLLDIKKENAFSKVTRKVNEYKKAHPEADVISLGIGDVSKPIIAPIREAMVKAVNDLGSMDTFKGYGCYYGYDFLKEKILENEYQKFDFTFDEIFISNGTKTDSGNLLELFDRDSKILVGNPCYPIYENSAKALSRNIYYAQNNDRFNMVPPKDHYDIIYICSPNNPIGNTYSYQELKEWVEYANKNNAVIFYDNVYHCFINSNETVDSIYEIEGARNCCIEMRSFSKTASFTAVRCSYYILPKELGLTEYWKERTLNRFNGADYIAQRGAEAVYLPESQKEIKKNIDEYLENARYLKKGFEDAGFKVIGGIDAPYMWIKCKECSSWQMFDLFLKQLNIIIIPGIIFGDKGDEYFRVSALGNKKNSEIAIDRIKNYYEKEH